jgi:hypothetical protein
MNGKPPVEYLSELTNLQLGQFELRRLNQVANLQREIRVAATEILEAIFETPIAKECIELKAEGLLARWLIEHRQKLTELPIRVLPDEFLDLEGSAGVGTDAVLSLVNGRTGEAEKLG